MVAQPGDPTYGKRVADLGDVKIDIAYAGSCTAGKIEDLNYYARVALEALEYGRKVARGVDMYIPVPTWNGRPIERKSPCFPYL